MTCSALSIKTFPSAGNWLQAVLFGVALLSGTSHMSLGQDGGVDVLLERATTAGANADQMQTVARRARQAGLSREAAASLLRPAVGLAEEDLPAEPVLTKALEGLAKQLPPDRIEPVLLQQSNRTEQAGQVVSRWRQQPEVKRLLGSPEDPPGNEQKPNVENRADAQEKSGTRRMGPEGLITAAADALQQDVRARDLEAFLNGLPEKAGPSVSAGQLTAAIGVLPDLLAAGTSLETAGELLTSAIGAGYGPESLSKMPEALQTARRASDRPVDVLAKGTARAAVQCTPAATVLERLFQGGVSGAGPPPGLNVSGTTPGLGNLPTPASRNAGPPSEPDPPNSPSDRGSSGPGSP